MSDIDFRGEQPRVRHNRYDVLNPPELGMWEPQLPVTIVIPGFRNQAKLNLVLAALAAQSYPQELMEVIVVDDGSEPPLTIPGIAPTNTSIIPNSPLGWGSALGVDTGSRAAKSDVILRLDADMLTYHRHVEAHMRWHHLCDYLVVLGSLRFTAFEDEDLSPAQAYEVVGADKTAELFNFDESTGSWVQTVYDKSDNLLNPVNRAYRVADGATISWSRRMYEAAGGMDPALILGGDTEFGFRLAQTGAVFIPEPEAASWHLGVSQMNARKEAGRRYRLPFLSQRVPLEREWRRAAGQQWEVPYVDVVINVESASFEEVQATATAALAGTLPDVRVNIVAPWQSLTSERRSPLDDELLDLRLIEETFRTDSRVRLVESVPETSAPSPFRFICPPGLAPTRDGLRQLIELANADMHGKVMAAIDTDTGLQTAILERTEAVNRTRWLLKDGEDFDTLLRSLFGIHWMDAGEWALAQVSEVPDVKSILRVPPSVESWRRQAEDWQRKAQQWKKEAQVTTKQRLKRALKRKIIRR